MSNLYNIVKNVIDAPNLDESEDILYGVNGIKFNSEEYFKNVISNFIKKKERIIKKEGHNLLFNLDYLEDIYNIIFIGEYAKENDKIYNNQFIDKYNLLTNEISRINSELKNLEKHGYQKTDEIYKQKEKELDDKKKEKDSLQGTFNTFCKYNDVRLINSGGHNLDSTLEKSLMQDIHIVHKLRCSCEHGKTKIGEYLEINDSNFTISIPLEYFEGFNSGRIIANDKDKIIIERTNAIALPIFESLEYDVKKIESFFYNINPEYLSFLLEQVNYDYDELYKLNYGIFGCEAGVKEYMKRGVPLSEINTLPPNAIFNYKNAFELQKDGFNIYDLPNDAFYDPSTVSSLLKEGIRVYNLAKGAFDRSAYTLDGDSVRYFHQRGYSAILLNRNGINIYDLPNLTLPENAFFYPEKTIEFRDKGFDVYHLKDDAFECDVQFLKELQDNGFNIYDLPNDAFICSVQELNRLKNEGNDIYNPKTYIGMYPILDVHPENRKLLQDNGINVDELLVYATFQPEIIIKLFDNNIDIYQLPDRLFFSRDFCESAKVENIKYLLKITNDDYKIFEKIPIEFLTCDTSMLDTMYKTYNLNIARSIFGIKNPKLIATLVYCDNVFKQYNNIGYENISIDPTNFILEGYKNINDASIDKNIFMRDNICNNNYYQCCTDGKNISFDFNDQKKCILNKLRNASCHFRFKPVKDKEGNILEDKIYLYDKPNNSDIPNFEMIIDIKYLVEIAREVERFLEIDEKIDEEVEQNGKMHI